MNVTIAINRQYVMGVVEGLTASIAQHAGGSPTFEELWASAGDSSKLDVWYRDAIADLESALKKWVTGTTALFSKDSGDFSVTLSLDDRWDASLKGVLANKVQYYFVHSIMAGWLQDFPQVTAVNYVELVAADLQAINQIILRRNLETTEEVKNGDKDKKSGDAFSVGPSARWYDTPECTCEDIMRTTVPRDRDDCRCRRDSTAGMVTSRDRDDCRHEHCTSRPWAGEGLGVMPEKRHRHRPMRKGDLTDIIFNQIENGQGNKHHH